MRKENLLLVIDMQNDFCLPTGALYVKGAERDVNNLSEFINRNSSAIDNIILSLDNHQIIDISHPTFWKNSSGENPEPFTSIVSNDLASGKWTPAFSAIEAIEYISALENQREYQHIIWPEHCIAGTTGAAIVDELMNAVKDWARTGKFFGIIQKGINPLTEHFGVLRANIPLEDDVDTMLNQKLINTINSYKNLVIAGEAKSHCVANTVKQLLELANLEANMIILDDTMSDVAGFKNFAAPIYKKAVEQGVIITNTKSLTLK